MRRMPLFAALAALSFAMAGVPGLADPVAGSRGEAVIASMDANAVTAALIEDRAVLLYYLAELHRRYPSQVEAPDMAGLPAIEPGAAAALRALGDDPLMAAMERVSAEVDLLAARAESFDTVSTPSEAPISRATEAAAEPTEADYCRQMYGKTYMLCASDDRGCKMIAANDWGICKKTGRWP